MEPCYLRGTQPGLESASMQSDERGKKIEALSGWLLVAYLALMFLAASGFVFSLFMP